MPTIFKKIQTPSSGSAPDILTVAGKVEIGPGATEGFDDFGTKGDTTHGLVACADAAPIATNRTAYVFLSLDGKSGFLDSDPGGANLPVGAAFKVGRAWKGSDGDYIVCQGKRANGLVSYNIGGDPVPRRLIDQGSSASPATPVSPFQGGGQMTYHVRVTVKGSGNATVNVVDALGNVLNSQVFAGGTNNKADTLVIPSNGDIVQFTTDPGVTITVLVDKGTENV